MARYNYSSQGFDRIMILGALFMNGHESEARFLKDDILNGPRTGLFAYDSKQGMALPGLTAIMEGKTETLKKSAADHPGLVRTLFKCAQIAGDHALWIASESRNPQAVKDVIETYREVYPEFEPDTIFRLVDKVLLSDSRRFPGYMSLEHLDAINSVLKDVVTELEPEQQEHYRGLMKKALTEKIAALPSGFSPDDYARHIGIVMSVLGKEEGTACIRASFSQQVEQEISRAHGKTDGLAALFLAAKKAGLTDRDITDALSGEDFLGRTLFDRIADGSNAETLRFLMLELANAGGKEGLDRFVNFLFRPKAVFDKGPTYTLQNVRTDENTKKIQPLCCLRPRDVKADPQALRERIREIAPLIRDWLDNAKPAASKHEEESRAALRRFADEYGPVTEGPSIFAYVSGSALEFFLTLAVPVKGREAGKERQNTADWFYEDMAKVMDLDGGSTGMHRYWAGSSLMGPPGSENCVREYFSGFVAALDRSLGTDVAVPLLGRLLALKDAAGQRPLDRALSDGPEGNYAKWYYPVIVKGVAAALGDDAKFSRYMDEAIVPNLPESFGGRKPGTSAAVGKYLKPGGPAP